MSSTPENTNAPTPTLIILDAENEDLRRANAIDIEPEMSAPNTTVEWCLTSALPRSYDPSNPDQFWGIIDAIRQHEPDNWGEAEGMFDEYMKVIENEYVWRGELEEYENEIYEEFYDKWNNIVQYFDI